MAKRLRWDGLTEERRAKFLNALVETGSVTRAAMMVGKRTPSAFYKLRERDRAFADAWDHSLSTVYARIEGELMERVIATEEAEREAKLAPLTFDEMMRLLGYFQSRDKGTKFGRKRRYATKAETDAVLMERLDMLEGRVRKRQAKERAERRAAREKAAAVTAE